MFDYLSPSYADVNSTVSAFPGGINRWQLQDDNSGLSLLAQHMGTVDTMSALFVLYTSTQGFVIMALIVRLMVILSAQKRLSVITSTIVKASPEIAAEILGSNPEAGGFTFK